MMDYVNKRGGTVSLQNIAAPNRTPTSIDRALKDALQLKKDSFQNFTSLARQADARFHDPELGNFIQENLLTPLVDLMAIMARWLTQINRVTLLTTEPLSESHLIQAHQPAKAASPSISQGLAIQLVDQQISKELSGAHSLHQASLNHSTSASSHVLP